MLLLVGGKIDVTCRGRQRIAGVRPDRRVHRDSASVMQIRKALAQPPQRSGPHLVGAGGGLRDAVGKRSHVVEQQIRIERHGFAAQRRDGCVGFAGKVGHRSKCRDGRQCWRVTCVAMNLREQCLARNGIGRQRQCRRRTEQTNVVAHAINIRLAGRINDVVRIGDGI